jgi:hypothetical protein
MSLQAITCTCGQKANLSIITWQHNVRGTFQHIRFKRPAVRGRDFYLPTWKWNRSIIESHVNWILILTWQKTLFINIVVWGKRDLLGNILCTRIIVRENFVHKSDFQTGRWSAWGASVRELQGGGRETMRINRLLAYFPYFQIIIMYYNNNSIQFIY